MRTLVVATTPPTTSPASSARIRRLSPTFAANTANPQNHTEQPAACSAGGEMVPQLVECGIASTTSVAAPGDAHLRRCDNARNQVHLLS
jgi:hypothetical protein